MSAEGYITPRNMLVAMLMVGRNLQELRDFGRILTDGERRELDRLRTLSAAIRQVGWDHCMSGGKLKANPHAGGSLEWWSWHDGYKAAERQRATDRRLGHATPLQTAIKVDSDGEARQAKPAGDRTKDLK